MHNHIGVNDSSPLVVAAAMCDGTGRVLIQRRPPGRAHAGLWEFPGGKVEPGETPAAALVRELAEELGISADPATLAFVAETPAGGGDRPLRLRLYRVGTWTGVPHPLHAVALAWVAPADMAAWAMPPADYPLAAALTEMLAVRPA